MLARAVEQVPLEGALPVGLASSRSLTATFPELLNPSPVNLLAPVVGVLCCVDPIEAFGLLLVERWGPSESRKVRPRGHGPWQRMSWSTSPALTPAVPPIG